MSKIKRFNIGNREITFVGKYRYSKNNDTYSNLTEWREWELGFWFKRNKVIGAKSLYDPRTWKDKNNLVNQYMIGINLFIFKAWFTVCKPTAKIEIEEQKEMEDSYYFEKISTTLIETGKVYGGMTEEDMSIEIYNQAKIDLGAKRAKYMMNTDEDFLSDTISEINERLKIKV